MKRQHTDGKSVITQGKTQIKNFLAEPKLAFRFVCSVQKDIFPQMNILQFF